MEVHSTEAGFSGWNVMGSIGLTIVGPAPNMHGTLQPFAHYIISHTLELRTHSL